MTDPFNSSAAQVQAASILLATMAIRNLAKAAFDKFEAEILESGKYHYDDKYLQPKYAELLEIPPDKAIRCAADIHMLSGLGMLGTDKYACTEAAKYYSELGLRAGNAGWVHAENAYATISHDVAVLESSFIQITENIHLIDNDSLSGFSLSDRAELVRTLLEMFCPMVTQGQNLDTVARKVYHQYLNPKQQAVNEFANWLGNKYE
jgi:hypothetical protein